MFLLNGSMPRDSNVRFGIDIAVIVDKLSSDYFMNTPNCSNLGARLTFELKKSLLDFLDHLLLFFSYASQLDA